VSPRVGDPMTPAQAAFWERFVRDTGQAGALREMDAFGDSEAMKDELLALVLAGVKRATTSLARWYDPDTRPRPGDLSLITDGRGAPACIIRTTQVDVTPICDVDAEFAYAEGEGDRSLEYWLAEHRRFFMLEAEQHGFEYSDDLDVVCERFECIWPLASQPARGPGAAGRD